MADDQKKMEAESKKVGLQIKKLAPYGANFAIAIPADDDDDPVIMVSKSKDGASLAKKAKMEAQSQRVAYGVLAKDQGKVQFRCEVKPPPVLKLRMKKFFKKYGLGQCLIVLPGGLVDEDEGGVHADQTVVDLRTSFAAALPAAEKAAETDPAKAETLRKLKFAFQKAILNDPPDVTTAGKLLAATNILAKGPAGQPAAANRGPQPAAAQGGGDPPPPNDDPAAKAKRIGNDWAKVVRGAQADIGKLKSEIKKATEGLPGAGKVDKAFGRIEGNLNQLATSVLITMQKIRAEPDAAKESIQRTVKVAEQIEKFLATDPFFKDVDANPFVSINASGALRQSLAKMKTDLTA